MSQSFANHKRIFIRCDKEYKNSHSFENGDTIKLQRQFDNFDRKYTQPVNAIVIDSAIIPQGAEVLCHHNATHATYELPDYIGLDGNYLSGNERYFSIPEDQCYAWRVEGGEWQPAPGFEFGLRIFKPYTGTLSGILPSQIKNKLFITTGEFSGKAVMTKGHCDYTIIFQDRNGREGQLIRLRHFPDEPAHIREEIVAIDLLTTGKVRTGELEIGLSPTNCFSLMLSYGEIKQLNLVE
jgi:hypothetical protein